MKLNIPAIICPGATTVEVDVVRNESNDAILDSVARRVLDIQQLCRQEKLYGVMATDQVVGQLAFRESGALFDSVFAFTSVNIEVSQSTVTFSFFASYPQACGVSLAMIHLSEDLLVAMLLNDKAPAHQHCAWCGTDQALVDGQDGQKHCPVCERGNKDQVGSELHQSAHAAEPV